MRRERIFVLASVLALAGCHAPAPRPAPPPKPHAQVSYEAVADKHLHHYILQPAQVAVAPSQLPDNPAPEYPPALISRHLPPVDVMALLIVDARGRVSDVRIAHESGDSPQRRAFDAAVRKAALAWRFEPLRIATWEEDAQGNEHRVSAEPRPFSQTYRFRFQVRDGKPVVTGVVPHPV